MTTKPEKTAKAKVRVNKVGDSDEVFITSDDPYVNKVLHTKHGEFKDGEISLSELEKKEAAMVVPNPDLGKIEPAAGS